MTKVRVLPYHDLARSKYASLEMTDTMPPDVPSHEAMQKAEETLQQYGLVIGH